MYVLVLVAGVHALLTPLESFQAHTADYLAMVWAGFIVTGGVLGVLDVLTARPLEVPAIVSILVSVVSYAVVLLYLGYTDGRGGAYLVVGYIMTAFGAGLVGRLVELRRLLRTTED